ncbi:MAG TPA: pyruvate:ferredoxin (flavodoxin) oxidoreductase [Thermoanaerobaculales bacterium]|nr:pyruvate:ferredoxin (flavodoxin) oxidoreductase [Thermoanaerobaculales bacterium]
MARRQMVMIDGNEAASSVAHRINDVCAIYPITPSSNMGEWADEWSAMGRTNIWGTVPDVIEMQSEAGAAGAVHGSLQAGALTTTFTASQGLLLMIPNMYKIAGELTSTVFHVSARTVAAHALSIFGDHSDINACRQTGWALMASGSVQEAHDFACIAQMATLASRVPFLHFFDGFRTSHEVATVELLEDDDLRHLIDDDLVRAHRERALSPDRPVLRGAAQNPDTFFQAREAINGFYTDCPGHVESAMKAFSDRVGRSYRLFDYVGAPDAERVVVIMGSGAEAVHEMVDWLNARGEKVGVVKVRLYRPFSVARFIEALPKTVRRLAVMDRTKEPGSIGEPLYMDVLTALIEARSEGISPFATDPVVVGGRYGLSSKEFNDGMVKAIFDNLAADRPRNHFTVGIVDDVTHTSLPIDDDFDIAGDDVFQGVFFGLGADGTVGANKNSIKIIGEETDNFAQGYFVYDSKKAGAVTISHLRFGPRPIRASYLIRKAKFVAAHQWVFLEKLDMLAYAQRGAIFLVNAPFGPDKVWDELPREVQQDIIDKKLKVYCIDATAVARDAGMGRRTNTIMQTCFFAISGILPREEAIAKIKESIKKTYSKKGDEIVRLNFEAVDTTLANLHEVKVPAKVTATKSRPPIVSDAAPDLVKKVTALMIAGKGDLLPVSAFPPDGTWPTATTQWEKRNIAIDIPVWDEQLCIQCNKCMLVCPHAAIRVKVYPPALLKGAPATFKSVDYKAKDFAGSKYTIQIAPEDCTGCTLCARVCPARDKSNPKHKALDMTLQMPLREQERANFEFFLSLPEVDREKVKIDVKGSQFFRPLFEYSGACEGCGETPYVKLLTQLFGDRALIGNATGCSSIYGGNLPTTPYAVDPNGRGPAWNNSLFEDTAEFTLGFRLAVDQTRERAVRLLKELAASIGDNLVDELLAAEQDDEAGIAAQRRRVEALRAKLAKLKTAAAAELNHLADYLVRKSVWGVGGDGWAYDIGYGGLDHVLGVGRDVNLLVLDTGVYSNTGGQASKATPLGAAAKFAMSGKGVPRKDLGLMAMAYGHVYVAQVAFGAKDSQTVRAFLEAESYRGPSLIIAYSHCIAHGFNLADGLDHQELAVDSGAWPLYRYDPRRAAVGENPLKLDSKAPSIAFTDFALKETRFRMLQKSHPERAKQLLAEAEKVARARFDLYRQMAEITYGPGADSPAGETN